MKQKYELKHNLEYEATKKKNTKKQTKKTYEQTPNSMSGLVCPNFDVFSDYLWSCPCVT